MSTILVTGAAGFIGSSLVREFAARGYEVRGIDNLATGRMANLDGVIDQIAFRQGDICDRELIRELCDGVDAVFHEAALPSVPKSVLDPVGSHQANINGTLSVLMAARDAGVRRVIYAASSSAYGESPTLPKREDMATAPISPYAVQKLAGELYMKAFARVYGMETVCLRYFNVFGPSQAADSTYSGVLAKFITLMLSGVSPVIYGDGGQSRDFTYIDNVVQANLLAATAPAQEVSGKAYNVACGRRFSLLETYYLIADMIGFKKQPLFASPRKGDIQHSLADIVQAERDLGYRPIVGFEEGLRRTINWYARQLDTHSELASAVA